MAAIFLALVSENTELREQLRAARDMLMKTAIGAGHLHARIEAVPAEREGGAVRPNGSKPAAHV